MITKKEQEAIREILAALALMLVDRMTQLHWIPPLRKRDGSVND
jgi:hypothetical protein